MEAIKSLVFLETVSTNNLRTPCKVLGYVNMLLFGAVALILHVYGIVFVLTHEWSPRRLLYEAKEIEESWMVCRVIFSFFFIKGVRESNVSYVLPIIIDASTQMIAACIFLMLQPFSYNEVLGAKRIAQLVLGFSMDLIVLILAGNYYRRLKRGNLAAESEQP